MMPGNDSTLQCEKCGSVYFQKAEFREYHSGYSATPGGELHPVESQRSIPVRICLCGHPIPWVTTLDQKTSRSFETSLEKAVTFRETREPKALRKHFNGKYASRKELQQVQENISKLLAIAANRQSSPKSIVAKPASTEPKAAMTGPCIKQTSQRTLKR